MAQIMTLSGSPKRRGRGLAADESAPSSMDGCKCVFNPRTKRSVLLCTVPKSQSRSGKAFKKDLHGLCRR